MIRFILLTLLNLSLPFLIRAAYVYWQRWHHKRKPEMVDVTPPNYDFPLVKLLLAGLLLMFLTLAGLRLFVEPDTFEGNQVRSEDIKWF